MYLEFKQKILTYLREENNVFVLAHLFFYSLPGYLKKLIGSFVTNLI